MLNGGTGDVPKPVEQKTGIPQQQVGSVTAPPAPALQFGNRPPVGGTPSMAPALAAGGVGMPQQQFNPQMANAMLNQRGYV